MGRSLEPAPHRAGHAPSRDWNRESLPSFSTATEQTSDIHSQTRLFKVNRTRKALRVLSSSTFREQGIRGGTATR